MYQDLAQVRDQDLARVRDWALAQLRERILAGSGTGGTGTWPGSGPIYRTFKGHNKVH